MNHRLRSVVTNMRTVHLAGYYMFNAL